MPGVTDYVAPNHQEVNILCFSIQRLLNPSRRCSHEHADAAFSDGGVHRESLCEVASLFVAHQFKSSRVLLKPASPLLMKLNEKKEVILEWVAAWALEVIPVDSPLSSGNRFLR